MRKSPSDGQRLARHFAPDIIRDAIQRVTGDPHQARREVVQAVLDDLASAGLTIRRKPLWRRFLRAGLLRLAAKLAPPEENLSL